MQFSHFAHKTKIFSPKDLIQFKHNQMKRSIEMFDTTMDTTTDTATDTAMDTTMDTTTDTTMDTTGGNFFVMENDGDTKMSLEDPIINPDTLKRRRIDDSWKSCEIKVNRPQMAPYPSR